jgi:predicted transcriptional regulator
MSKMIRMDEQAYAKLSELAKKMKMTKQKLLANAIEKLAREKFMEEVNKSYRKMRSNKKAWAEELKERALWDATLMDGLEDE